MTKTRASTAFLLAGLAMFASFTSAGAAPSAYSGSVEGWNEMLDGLRDLPSMILSQLPPEQQADPQIRQEVGRLALSAVTAASLDALASDPEHPTAVPQINNYLTIGQPNSDTSYRSIKVAPGGVYRMRGMRGSMGMVRIAQASPRPAPKGATPDLGGLRTVFDLNTLSLDDQGRYDVVLSALKPQGHAGDWWQLEPTTNMLLVRMVASDWADERQPTISIERLDLPVRRPRPSADKLKAQLRAVPAMSRTIAPLLVGRVQRLREKGIVNRLAAADFSNLGGLKQQFYYEGAYDLQADEALIIEANLPERCGYRSLILTNEIYETTDWYNNQSSLNGAQAKADDDGVLRIVVSEQDPGVPNWLDTSGYPRGVIQGRWTECSSHPVPKVTKVPVGEVRRMLPESTPVISPEERERLVRERRSAVQQRVLW